jgi:hypothetical protein
MKFSTFAAAAGALAITAFAASAHAADAAPGWTGELGAAVAHSSDSAFKVNLSSVLLRGGYTLNKNFAIEGEASFGVGDDSDSGVKFHQEYEVGVFVDGFVPVSENVDLLGRVGYAQTKIKATGFGLTDTNTASGAALGVGLRYFPNAGANGVRVDYTHYFFNKDSAVDGGSITWVHKF